MKVLLSIAAGLLLFYSFCCRIALMAMLRHMKKHGLPFPTEAETAENVRWVLRNFKVKDLLRNPARH